VEVGAEQEEEEEELVVAAVREVMAAGEVEVEEEACSFSGTSARERAGERRPGPSR